MNKPNKVATAIVDKNGVHTTRNKNVVADSVNTRLRGITKPPVPKRTLVENPWQIPADSVLEIAKITNEDKQAIYFNGERIGSLEKNEVVNNIGGGNKNYVLRQTRSSRWFATIHDNETDVAGNPTSLSGGATTRLKAVQDYAVSYVDNAKIQKIRKDFFDKGGEEFTKSSFYANDVYFRGKELKLDGRHYITGSFGSDRNKPTNVLTCNFDNNKYDIILDGEDSRVEFHTGNKNNQPVAFPLDTVNGLIESVNEDNNTFHDNVMFDTPELYSHAQKNISKIFNNQ